MKRDIHSLTDLVTGTPAAGHQPLYYTTGGWKTVAGQVFDVRSFGATGDGVTDDTTAIQAAQTAAGSTGTLSFPPGTYLVTDTISLGSATAASWRGQRTERGCNAVGILSTYHAAKIKFRPVDTTKWLLSRFETTSPSSAIGPFHMLDLAFDLGDANGFELGREDINLDGTPDTVTAGAGQRYVFGPLFRNCAFTSTVNTLTSVSEVITRSGRKAIHLTKAFEAVIDECSFFGGDWAIRTWGCDKPTIKNCRFQYQHVTVDLNGSGSFGVQHIYDNNQTEVWGITPLRVNGGITFSGSKNRFEHGAIGTGQGRFALAETASVTAGSGTLTFSSSMDGKLFPGVSLIELTDGTNTDVASVLTVNGTTVTVETGVFAFDWTNGVATVTRIHGYGPKVGSQASASFTGDSIVVATSCPSYVADNLRGIMTITGSFGATNTSNLYTSIFVGNKLASATEMNAGMIFTGCEPHIIGDPNHPFITVMDWRPDHGKGVHESTYRQFAGGLDNAHNLVVRRWTWTPKGGGTANSNDHLLLMKRLDGEANTNQKIWAWKLPAASNLHCYNFTLPATAGSIRLRVRIMGISSAGTLTFTGIRDASGGTVTTAPFTTSWSTITRIVPVPAQWIQALVDRDAQVGINLDADQDVYIAAFEVEEIVPGEAPAVSADNGDAAKTLTSSVDETTQRWNTALTAARAVTLSTTNAVSGSKFHIVRTANATGAFNLNVGTGPLKALATASTWCDVEYDGSAWMLTAYGAL